MVVKLQTLAVAATIFLFLSCSRHVTSGEVNFLGASEPGTVLVSSAGYGTSRPAAIHNAEVNAFQTLLFRGVAGSQYQLPLVPDEAMARQKHGPYLDELLKTDRYKLFMLQSEPETGYAGARRHEKNLKTRVKINVDALRRDLEQHQVIRKFGL